MPTPVPYAARRGLTPGSAPRAKFGALTLALFESKKSQTSALATDVAQKALARAKEEAPWQDRTRRARQRLLFFAYSRVRGTKLQHVVEGDHGMWYGFYLETKPETNGGRPILVPVIRWLQPLLAAGFRAIWANGLPGVRTRAAAPVISRRRGPSRSWVARNLRPEDR